MNKKILATSVLTAVVASSFVFVTSASAFWPFDSLFNKGEVKAMVSGDSSVVSEGAGGVMSQRDNIYSFLTATTDMCSGFDKIVAYGAPVGGVRLGITNTVKVNPSEKELMSIENAIRAECKKIVALKARFSKLNKDNTIIRKVGAMCQDDSECPADMKCSIQKETVKQGQADIYMFRAGYCVSNDGLEPEPTPTITQYPGRITPTTYPGNNNILNKR